MFLFWQINVGDVICEIETDKATVEFECLEEGYFYLLNQSSFKNKSSVFIRKLLLFAKESYMGSQWVLGTKAAI